MNGRDLTLGLVGALAVGAALGRRGSRATDPTSTPAFRRWFGESKVVDGAGRPLVVYHGSRSSKTFEVFRGSRRGWYGSGMYFTPDRDFAEGYAEDSDGNVGHLVSVYLRMERPYRYESRNFENKEFVRSLLSPRSAAAVLSRSDRESVGPGDSIRKALVARGYDGIIANNPDGTEYIVFEPTQIKSVDNRGTFDPADPRISFNRSAPTDAALRTLRAAMVKAARADTAYAPATWKRAKDPLTGHCYGAAHLVQDRFGGEIVKGTVRGQAHAWNRLPGGREVDLTGSQYGGDGMRPLVKGEGVATSRSTNPRFARFAARVDAQLALR